MIYMVNWKEPKFQLGGRIMNKNILMNHFYKVCLLVFLIGFIVNCASKEKTPKKTVLQESAQGSTATTQNPFEKLPEGFINANTFQVVVSSLKVNPREAEEEAKVVAEKKSFQMLQTYPQKPITPKGKSELKEISESGKITQRGKVGDKQYFVYQIQRPGLKLFVESKLP